MMSLNILSHVEDPSASSSESELDTSDKDSIVDDNDTSGVVAPVEPAEMPDSNPASNVSPGAASVTSSLLEDAQRSEVSPSVL